MRARWAWALLALAACSGKSGCSGGGVTSGPSRSNEACASWAEHYCGRLDFCAPLSVEVAYGDVARCIARNEPPCVSALRASGAGGGPASLEACARAYDDASCNDVVVGRPPAACRSGKTGAGLPPGAPCGDDAQCAGPRGYCRMSATQVCGTCAALGSADAPCESDKDCDDGLVCYFTCMAPVALGAACDGMSRQCPQTLVCYDYVCAAPAALGAKCNPQADPCDRDHGLFCDPRTRTCARYTLAEVGAPCGPGTVCKGATCDDPSQPGSAHAASSDVKPTCVAHARDGEGCDPESGSSCRPPARCIRGACQMPDPSSCL